MLGRILNGLELIYLIKYWLVGIFFYATLIYFHDEFPDLNIIHYFYFTISTILFPFSKMMLDEIKENMDEDYKFVIIFQLTLNRTLILMRILAIIFFWALAPFVIIFGIIYIFFADVL